VNYNVVVSGQVKSLLEELHGIERNRSRELALLLLRLEKDPRPAGSRQLSTGSSTKARSANEERLWDATGFRIAYRIKDGKRLVEVGIVTRSR
jgi:hypothetical protein